MTAAASPTKYAVLAGRTPLSDDGKCAALSVKGNASIHTALLISAVFLAWGKKVWGELRGDGAREEEEEIEERGHCEAEIE